MITPSLFEAAFDAGEYIALAAATGSPRFST
jgi:hypothetical protein